MSHKTGIGSEKTAEQKVNTKNSIKRVFLAGFSIILELALFMLIAVEFAAYAQWIAIVTRIHGGHAGAWTDQP